MKRLLLIFALAISAQCFSQAITVNTSTYTVPQLVNNVLINSPCVSASNITWKTGSNFGSSNGIGFFQNTNAAFPMQSGVILSTGNVNNAPGPNSIHLNDGAMNWPGDSDLEATLAAAGIPMNSVNATVLEFDFMPISPNFSFDFLFASEEYGNFQCEFSDAFAFLLTNENTGVTTNLAVVPSTNLPISVVTIRDFLYNSSCPSANSQFFGSYNGGSAAAGSATNYNGQTKVMNASAVMVPGTPYHIKLVIADRTDNESDSAIFLSSDSFNIGQDALGPDLTVAANTAICHGQSYVIDSELDPTIYSFTWKNGGLPIVGQTGPTLTITQPGTYELTYQYLVGTCSPIVDTVTIEYYPEITTQDPITLYKCSGSGTYVYDLSINTPIVKTGLDAATVVTYHATQAAANAGTPSLPLNYTSAGGQTVYVRIKSPNSPCYVVKSFQLLTAPAPVAHQPADLTLCARSQTLLNGIFNLGAQTPAILAGQSNTLNTVTYYTSQANANSGTNPLGNTYIGVNNTVIYVRVQNATDVNCYSTTSFTLHIDPLPPVDSLMNVVLCEPYVLPPLVNGNYFSAPNGGGTAMFAGDVILETQVIYIFNQPGGPDSCSAGSSFKVTIIDPLTLSPGGGTYCGSYSLPSLENGDYYTAPGGPTGTGTLLNAGTEITTSQTLYVYFKSLTPPFCIIDTDFDVTILPSINIGEQPNVFDCTSYTLPAFNGTYYTEPNAGGIELPAGTVITSTQSVYAYAETGAPNHCKTEKQFKVFIGIDTPGDISQCNGYPLPELPIGNYYTGPAGTGDMIAAGTVLEQTTTVYIYVPKTNPGGPNCTDDVHFTAYIAQPLIDHIEDQTVCESFTLPVLASGVYYTGPEQSGTELAAGDIITTTQTIYIFKRSTPTCYNEDSFTITVNPKPAIDSRSDIDVCNKYELTTLAVGNYYTGPGGTGTMLPGGTFINETQTIYIFAENNSTPPCHAENHFTITVFHIEADQPDDVVACDSYTLPALTVGNYYTMPGGPSAGEGTIRHAGDVITESTTLYIYTESGERINCIDENSFNITINHTPFIGATPNEFACNSFTLEALPVGNYYTGPNKTGTQMHEGDVITSTQTLYVYSETGTTPNCSDEKSFTVNIFNVDELNDVTTCQSYVLPQLTNGRYYTGPNRTGIAMNAGQSVSTSQTIYINAAAPWSPTCYDESSFEVTIVPEPVANPVVSTLTTVCDEDGINDGVTSFDLTTLTSAILGTQTGAEFTVAYYATQADAAAQTNAITSTTSTVAYARVNNTLTANCYDLMSVGIVVNKIPKPTPVGGIICYDSKKEELLRAYTIPSGLSAANHTFQWFNEAGDIVGTGSSYTAVLPGEYSVIATSSITGCPSAETFVTVAPSEPALISFTITDDFSDNQVVTVEAQGVGGDYEYQLDHGPWQDSNVFTGVSSGTHTVNVRDKNGCGTSTSSALVVNYPKYFTPNGDGFHDTWNIVDLEEDQHAKISIFDRYGKFITQVFPHGPGWDGTHNGKTLPSTDYWFVVNYQEDGVEKEFKAHFAMKR